MMALFDRCYRQADHAYLEKALGRLKYVSTATRAGALVGFALGEARVLDLPRLPGQLTLLAGICCIAPEMRRRRLFGELERRSMLAAGLQASGRILSCGRMAHPASLRVMQHNAGVVPRRGVRPTPWQQAVGTAIADAYGVAGFDPETFVCRGSGTPIGYPILEVEATPEDWELFGPVDRDRGDSLLGISWMPDAPEGW
jgi:hypothetical protein